MPAEHKKAHHAKGGKGGHGEHGGAAAAAAPAKAPRRHDFAERTQGLEEQKALLKSTAGLNGVLAQAASCSDDAVARRDVAVALRNLCSNSALHHKLFALDVVAAVVALLEANIGTVPSPPSHHRHTEAAAPVAVVAHSPGERGDAAAAAAAATTHGGATVSVEGSAGGEHKHKDPHKHKPGHGEAAHGKKKQQQQQQQQHAGVHHQGRVEGAGAGEGDWFVVYHCAEALAKLASHKEGVQAMMHAEVLPHVVRLVDAAAALASTEGEGVGASPAAAAAAAADVDVAHASAEATAGTAAEKEGGGGDAPHAPHHKKMKKRKTALGHHHKKGGAKAATPPAAVWLDGHALRLQCAVCLAGLTQDRHAHRALLGGGALGALRKLLGADSFEVEMWAATALSALLAGKFAPGLAFEGVEAEVARHGVLGCAVAMLGMYVIGDAAARGSRLATGLVLFPRSSTYSRPTPYLFPSHFSTRCCFVTLQVRAAGGAGARARDGAYGDEKSSSAAAGGGGGGGGGGGEACRRRGGGRAGCRAGGRVSSKAVARGGGEGGGGGGA